jgi:hypothetical protein
MHTGEILEDLKNDDPQLQDSAIIKLQQIGSAEAIQILTACLDNTKWREEAKWQGPSGETAEGRNIYEPVSFLAAKALASIIPGAPPPPDGPMTSEFVTQLKSWLEGNKNHHLKGDISS